MTYSEKLIQLYKYRGCDVLIIDQIVGDLVSINDRMDSQWTRYFFIVYLSSLFFSQIPVINHLC